MEFELVAEGLGFPEGPVWMEDGSVILVEIQTGKICRVWGGGKTETIASPGGGPNGAAIGPDGALWVCNNGGFLYHQRNGVLLPGNCPDNYSGGRIERLDLSTGKVERVLDRVDEHPLKGPNDLVFDRHGNLYFTDHGKTYARHRDFGGIYFLPFGESEARELDFHRVSPNGIGLSPDESTLYVADTLTCRLIAYDLVAPGLVQRSNEFSRGRVVGGGVQFYDSLAVTVSGNVCVATIMPGGISTITPQGLIEFTALPDPLVTNICFGGADMQDAWITLSGTGKLIKTRWPEPGLRLNYYA